MLFVTIRTIEVRLFEIEDLIYWNFIFHHPVTTPPYITTERGKVFYLRSTDRLLWSDDKIIGGKTGYTRRAGHCFVCAAQGETRTILVAILGSPSRKNLWTETKRLVSRNLQGSPP